MIILFLTFMACLLSIVHIIKVVKKDDETIKFLKIKYGDNWNKHINIEII